MKFWGKSLSRRTLVRNLGLAAGAGLLGVAGDKPVSAQPANGAGSGKPRALALVGDRFHNPDYIRVSMDRTFKELGIPIDYTIQYDQISSDLLKNYQLFLILRDGMIWPGGYLGPDAWSFYDSYLENKSDFPEPKPERWITEEQGAAIQDFVKAGNGFYAFHNCSDISLGSKNYRDVMGGAYDGHPPLRPFRVRVSANKHPITEGIQEFTVDDEQHYVKYDKDPKYVILEAENIDGLDFNGLGTKSISGWAYDYGQGRVVFTAVGHTIHALWNPQYVEVQKRSIKWLLKQL
ncbi:MAG TPA: ThuA domain-containing protein [Acidobacteriaceae bacterium]|nr:ThuA domain-containing protein [Acidobacteriaceae bacterium]